MAAAAGKAAAAPPALPLQQQPGGAAAAAAAANPPAFRISGFDVCFPHPPYGVQKVFINQVIKAIDHQENALLEAPTGCGKTLSLLCGALAWQHSLKQQRAAAEQAAAERVAAEKAATGKLFESVGRGSKLATASGAVAPQPAAATGERPTSAGAAPPPPGEEEDEPIVVPKIYYATRTHSQIAQVVRELKRTAYKPKMAVLGSRPHYCINAAVIRKGSVDAGCEELLKDRSGCKYKKNAASIGHRTAQVHDIEDLARLGKRHQACPYFAARHLAESAELVFCPYSYLLDPSIRRSTRVNAAGAVLIFDEAHNIEDQAREAGTMELDLDQLKTTFLALSKAAVMSSEADTYQPLADAVLKAIQWMLGLAQAGGDGAGPGFKSAGFESFERIWAGQQMLAALEDTGLGPQAVEHLWACYEKARAAEEKAGFNTEGEAGMQPVPADVASPRAGGNALGAVSSLLAVLRLMYGTYTEPLPPGAAAAALPAGAAAGAAGGAGSGGGAAGVPVLPLPPPPGGDNVADYRLAVQMWLPRDTNGAGRGRRDRRNNEPAAESARAFAEASGGTATTTWAFRFCLWCLNPAVVFRSLSHMARSVLLTSGTLSPLDSFSGELGLDFHVKLEAPHVVNVAKQVFARVVGRGLDGHRLVATYKEADKLDYQDSLGALLLGVCRTTPDGVLLFLPSYALMDKLSRRWQDTGLMNQLQAAKAVFSEPRQAGDAFDTTIKKYYAAIDEGRGGLFLAVCRGKVSEGIDFADARARCVLVVGIPYPHAKDSKVALKKEYNNSAAAAAGGPGGAGRGRPAGGGAGGAGAGAHRLLSGDAWYSQQAFRALNQAIGRCIRHRLDYGAILLVDERFGEARTKASLSKWVRATIQPTPNAAGLLPELAAFFQGLSGGAGGGGGDAGGNMAAAAAAAGAPPPLPAGVKKDAARPGGQQQQQQPLKQGAARRVSGPMDAFLVSKQQQQQQQAEVPKQQQPQQQQAPVIKQEQAGIQQQQPLQQQEQQQEQHGAAGPPAGPPHAGPASCSCMSVLAGCIAHAAPPPPQQQPAHKQQQPLQEVDANAAHGAAGPAGAKMPASAAARPLSAAAATAAPPPQVPQAVAMGPSGVKQEQEQQPGNSGPAAPAAPAPAPAPPPMLPGIGDLQSKAAWLGLSMPLAQQWVAADLAGMQQHLQRQPGAAASGMGLLELATFGVMAAFDKALEVVCGEQQQQQQSGSLAPFWAAWHSPVPLGLLAVAAAAQQALPPAAQAAGVQQGPWTAVMQQQRLADTLQAMAALYDAVLEVQQQGLVPGLPPQHQHQHQQAGHHGGPPRQGWQQQQQQQQQGWQSGHQQQRFQQHPHHHQQQQRGPPGAGLPSRPGSNGTTAAPPAASAGGGPAAPSAPPSKLQLSQSVRQPKRAAVMSAKAQLAAQKRSKAAAAGGGPAAANGAAGGGGGGGSEDDDDDDFL